jgi:uroporphyrinogen decarboxylase
VSLDQTVPAAWASASVRAVLQGNLDPHLLVGGGQALVHAIRSSVTTFTGKPHIFNLGHGVLPQTPIAHVELLVQTLRQLPGA